MRIAVQPLAHPPDAVVRVPGSKSITNRALVCAALARGGTSTIRGVLQADDGRAMTFALGVLGWEITDEGDALRIIAGRTRTTSSAWVDARDAATVARFLLPVLATLDGEHRVDGSEQLRRRPMGPLLDALRALGVTVAEEGQPGRLPVRVSGPLRGGEVTLPGDVSSQFASGLMLVAPLLPGGLRIILDGSVVSRPYLAMTAAVMAAFGADAEVGDSVIEVPEGAYRACDYDVEPDASAASYFFAAAAICGGRVEVQGLGTGSLQGDLGFVDVLAGMGAEVSRTAAATEVRGGTLAGTVVDLADLSDTVPTLAAIAPFASSETRITGVGFIRGKESDRIGDVVAGLRRLGVDAEGEADGLTVAPSAPHGARVSAMGDHRLAMAFALIGLRVPGVEIQGAECVAKTFPDYFAALDQLR